MSFGESGSLSFSGLLSIFIDFILSFWSKEPSVSGTTSPCSSSSKTAENFHYKVRLLFHAYLLQFLFWDLAFGDSCILLFSCSVESSEIDLSEFQEENENAGAVGGDGNDNNGDANGRGGDGNENRGANDGKLLLTHFPLTIITLLSLVMHWVIICRKSSRWI